MKKVKQMDIKNISKSDKEKVAKQVLHRLLTKDELAILNQSPAIGEDMNVAKVRQALMLSHK